MFQPNGLVCNIFEDFIAKIATNVITSTGPTIILHCTIPRNSSRTRGRTFIFLNFLKVVHIFLEKSHK